MIRHQKFCWNPFQVNCYLLYTESGEGWLIDAGAGNAEELEELDHFMRSKGITLSRLLCTHGHVDHVYGSYILSERYGVVPEIHQDDYFLYQSAPQQAELFGMPPVEMPDVRTLRPGELLLGNERIEAVHLPGHSPGSLGFYLPGMNILFAGDVIFKQGIGRTDLPGGNYSQLINTIQEQIISRMDDATVIYPGHGPETTVGEEKHQNPFLT